MTKLKIIIENVMFSGPLKSVQTEDYSVGMRARRNNNQCLRGKLGGKISCM